MSGSFWLDADKSFVGALPVPSLPVPLSVFPPAAVIAMVVLTKVNFQKR